VYLPQEDLSRFDISVDDLKKRCADERLKQLMRFEIERAREMFTRGKPLCGSVGGRLGLELRSVWLGGMRILERIEKNEYDVFRRRPVITPGDKIRILLGALSKSAFQN
jgi:phytoene/squalene synthetase